MLLELQQQSNDLLFVNESWPLDQKNGPLDRFWTVFRKTIGDPAQFFLSQLADLEVVSLLLHKTNRAEQRQLDSPPPRRGTVDRTSERFAKGHRHVRRFLFIDLFF